MTISRSWQSWRSCFWCCRRENKRLRDHQPVIQIPREANPSLMSSLQDQSEHPGGNLWGCWKTETQSLELVIFSRERFRDTVVSLGEWESESKHPWGRSRTWSSHSWSTPGWMILSLWKPWWVWCNHSDIDDRTPPPPQSPSAPEMICCRTLDPLAPRHLSSRLAGRTGDLFHRFRLMSRLRKLELLHQLLQGHYLFNGLTMKNSTWSLKCLLKGPLGEQLRWTTQWCIPQIHKRFKWYVFFKLSQDGIIVLDQKVSPDSQSCLCHQQLAASICNKETFHPRGFRKNNSKQETQQNESISLSTSQLHNSTCSGLQFHDLRGRENHDGFIQIVKRAHTPEISDRTRSVQDWSTSFPSNC